MILSYLVEYVVLGEGERLSKDRVYVAKGHLINKYKANYAILS